MTYENRNAGLAGRFAQARPSLHAIGKRFFYHRWNARLHAGQRMGHVQGVGRTDHHAIGAVRFEQISEISKVRHAQLPGLLHGRRRWVGERHQPGGARHARNHFNVATANLASARYRYPDWLHGLVSRNLRTKGDRRHM